MERYLETILNSTNESHIGVMETMFSLVYHNEHASMVFGLEQNRSVKVRGVFKMVTMNLFPFSSIV